MPRVHWGRTGMGVVLMIWLIVLVGVVVFAVVAFMVLGGGGLSGNTTNLLIWGSGIAIAVAIGLVVFTRMSEGQRHLQALQERGLRGSAEILRAEPTNVVVNRRPQARLQLRIYLPDRAPYEVEHLTLMPLTGFAPNAGQRYPVLVNPDQADDLMIDWTVPAEGVGSSAQPTSPAQRLEALDELRRKGLVSEVEYQRKRDEILSGL